MLFSPYCREFNSLQKRYTALLHRFQYFFQKIKKYGWWSAEKLTVKFLPAPGVRNRKFLPAPNNNFKIFLFGTKLHFPKILFGSQSVKQVDFDCPYFLWLLQSFLYFIQLYYKSHILQYYSKMFISICHDNHFFIHTLPLLLLLFFIRTQGTHTNSIVQINKEIIVKINYTKILN